MGGVHGRNVHSRRLEMSRGPFSIKQAQALVLAWTHRLGSEPVDLSLADGRVLAEDAVAAGPVPPFDNSAMDGFAVRAEDTRGATAESPISLVVVDESRAGRPAQGRVEHWQALAVSTGAVLPDGADAIVRVEDTRRVDDAVEVFAPVPHARDVRRAGEDVKRGDRVLAAGTPIGPAEAGVLASLGWSHAPCARRPRVAILTTGDELVPPGEPLGPGAVRDTNGVVIPLLAAAAGAETRCVRHVRDDRTQMGLAIEEALCADVVIVCGGVSAGEHDHVRPALADLGAQEVFRGVRLRPGAPAWFGLGPGDAPLVFGLPGNPVSAFVTFMLLAEPALRALQGAPGEPAPALVRLVETVPRLPGKTHAVRCSLESRPDGLWARPTGPQGSHVLTSMLGANCLALVPPAEEPGDPAEPTEALLLPGWFRLCR